MTTKKIKYKGSTELWIYPFGMKFFFKSGDIKEIEDKYADKILKDQPKEFEEVKGGGKV